jgi:hypothetical protein
LAAHIGHSFQHHHAQDEAEAAGRALLAMMKHAKANTPPELLQKRPGAGAFLATILGPRLICLWFRRKDFLEKQKMYEKR